MQVFFSLLSNDAHVRKATYYSVTVVTPFKIVLFPTSIICQAQPRAPALRANVKPALSHPVTGKELDRSTCYIQASLGAIALSPSLISSALMQVFFSLVSYNYAHICYACTYPGAPRYAQTQSRLYHIRLWGKTE